MLGSFGSVVAYARMFGKCKNSIDGDMQVGAEMAQSGIKAVDEVEWRSNKVAIF